ncbi:MAG: dicarboxylate/amino acid:cation symporter [Brevinema sp.]
MRKIFEAYKSSLLIFFGIVIGAVVGSVMGEKATMFTPIADLFLNLLFTIVVPLVFTSLVAAIGKMSDLQRLGKTLGWMLGIFIVTGLIASVYMIVVLGIWNPAQGAVVQLNEQVSELTQNRDFLAMFTVSDYSLLWSRRNLMALIVFTMLFSAALIQLGDRSKPVIDLFDTLSLTCVKFIDIIMVLAPIGLGAFFASLVGQFGQDIVGPLSHTILIYLLASVVYFIVFHSLFAYIGGGTRGVKQYWAHILNPSLTALGTSSSAATMPVTMVSTKKMGIPEDIADISIPLGVNLHKDGAAHTTILKIMFICSLYNVKFFTPENIITAILLALLVDIVAGAIPGGGFVGELSIIAAYGFPVESVPIMVLLGTVTDAFATVINVTGDPAVAMILARIIDGKQWIENRIKG